jgi:membrane associated rhomboid family serine protease
MSYETVVSGRQLWRCGAAQLAHVEATHLLFNLAALWSMGVVEEAPGLGSLFFLKYTALLLLLAPPLCMALYHAAIRLAGRDHYRSVTAVGYSCVLFGWMAILAARQPAGITALPLIGLGHVPTALAPFGSLLVTSALVPRASFVGHLAGILAGYLVAVPWLDAVPAWAALAGAGAAGAGLAANFLALRGGAGGDLVTPFLPDWAGGRPSAEGDVEGGTRGGGGGPTRAAPSR